MRTPAPPAQPRSYLRDEGGDQGQLGFTVTCTGMVEPWAPSATLTLNTKASWSKSETVDGSWP